MYDTPKTLFHLHKYEKGPTVSGFSFFPGIINNLKYCEVFFLGIINNLKYYGFFFFRNYK